MGGKPQAADGEEEKGSLSPQGAVMSLIDLRGWKPEWAQEQAMGGGHGWVMQLGEVRVAPNSLTWSLLNSSQLLRAKVSLSSDQHTEKANVC